MERLESLGRYADANHLRHARHEREAHRRVILPL